LSTFFCGRLPPFRMTTPPDVLHNNSAAQPPAPITISARPQFKGWFNSATIVLITLNVLVFLLMVFQGVSFYNPTADSVLKWGADYGPLTLHGQWWRMLASTFLHFGIVHLLFNMFVLLNIGLFMENLAGRFSFVVLYLVCGLGGSAVSLAWHPVIVSAGASGAIFGLYGALLGFLLRHRGSISPEALASQRSAALTFVGYNLLFGLRPGVDNSAHLGGLATGFVLGLFMIPAPSASSFSATPAELAPSSSFNGRVIVAVVLGLALIAVPMLALPKPDDYLAEYKHLGSIEENDIQLFNTSLKQWKAHQITDEQYSDILENQILPPWRAEREALEKLKIPDHQIAARNQLLVLYMTYREQGWQLNVDGLRNNDKDKIRQAVQKEAQAENVIAQLRSH
jgi:rhomboid protease GluP